MLGIVTYPAFLALPAPEHLGEVAAYIVAVLLAVMVGLRKYAAQPPLPAPEVQEATTKLLLRRLEESEDKERAAVAALEQARVENERLKHKVAALEVRVLELSRRRAGKED